MSFDFQGTFLSLWSQFLYLAIMNILLSCATGTRHINNSGLGVLQKFVYLMQKRLNGDRNAALNSATVLMPGTLGSIAPLWFEFIFLSVLCDWIYLNFNHNFSRTFADPGGFYYRSSCPCKLLFPFCYKKIYKSGPWHNWQGTPATPSLPSPTGALNLVFQMLVGLGGWVFPLRLNCPQHAVEAKVVLVGC